MGRVLRPADGFSLMCTVELGGGAILRETHGRVVVDVDDITYAVGDLDALDANLASCIPEHRDVLLDARLHLHRGAPS